LILIATIKSTFKSSIQFGALVMDPVNRTISTFHRQSDAEAAYRCHNYAEAERLYRFELASLETLQGSSYVDVALTLHKLTLVLEAQAKYDEAAKLRGRMSRTLKELRTITGEDDQLRFDDSCGQAQQCS
jgi:hypothetical protein